MEEAPRTLSMPIAISWKMLVGAFSVEVLTVTDSTAKRNMLYSFRQKANPTLMNETRFEIGPLHFKPSIVPFMMTYFLIGSLILNPLHH